LHLGLGYKIQKVLYKLDDLAHLLPEKKKEDIQGIQEAHEFLLVLSIFST